MKKRGISFLLVFVMTLAAFPAGIQIYGGEAMPIERIFLTYENLEPTEEFGANIEHGASYLSSDSKIMVVGPDRSVMGSRSLAVNQCDMRWWTLNANDKEYYVELSIKTDANYDNSLSMNFTTSQPSKSANKSASGDAFRVTKQDGKTVLLDGSGKLIKELEEDVRYGIRAVFERGSSRYKMYVNSILESEECEFAAPVYTVDGMQITVSDLKSAAPDPANGSQTSYILIDSPKLATKGRSYPQQYSAQAPGEIPDVTIPKAAETEDMSVYVNTTKIEMSYAPVLKDGILYTDLEQLLRCLHMELKQDNKVLTISNENVQATATLGSNTVTINGKEYTLDAPPRKINGTIMVPPNFLNEVLNAKVWWDEAHNMLVITTGTYKKDGILREIGGMLYMNGEPYYEISFNKFDLFTQIFADYIPNNEFPGPSYTYEAAETAVKRLNELGFKSIRVFCYSNSINDLMYDEEHANQYFEAMDKMFDLCDRYDMKVVVCLGLAESYLLHRDNIEGAWMTGTETVVELVTNKNSKSRENMNKYLDKFITRYKDRDSVLLWEIRNELGLEADIGSAVGSVKWSLLQLAEFYGDCADKIRSLDSEHLVTSGDAVLRKSQWNLFADVMKGTDLSWKTDTKEERLKAVALLNEKLDLISVHAYGVGGSGNGNDEAKYLNENGELTSYDFKFLMEEAKLLGKVLYNGETNGGFSYESKEFYTDTENYLNSIIDAGVQLSHWWTFRSDRAGFNDGPLWTIDGTDLLPVIVSANQRLKEKYVVNKAAASNTNDVWDDPMFAVFDAGAVINGKDFVVQTSFKSKMIRLGILCGIILVVGGAATFILTREKLKRKRKKEIDE